MRRCMIVGLLTISTLAVFAGPADAHHARPTLHISGISGPQSGFEGEVEHVLSIDAIDPDGVIVEVVVDFGDRGRTWASTFCAIFGPGENAHMEIPHAYAQPGSYTVRAFATSVSECGNPDAIVQESPVDAERVTISF
jgi:hypothetical protein